MRPVRQPRRVVRCTTIAAVSWRSHPEVAENGAMKFALWVVVAVLSMSSLALAQPVQEIPPPTRAGFTLSYGLGFGATTIEGESYVTVGGPHITIGGFLFDRVAVGGHLYSSTVFTEGDTELSIFFLGPVAQVWATDRLAISVGAGLGLLAFVFDGESVGDDEPGIAGKLKLDMTVIETRGGGLQAGIEYMPIVYDGFETHSMLFNLGYQIY